MDVARAHFENALVIHREVGNRGFQGIVLGNMGKLHCEEGRMEAARACFHDALTIHRELGDRRHEGITLGNLSVLLARQGQVREARDGFRTADALLREIDDGSELAKLLCARGAFEVGTGDAAAARSVLAEAEKIAVAIGAGPGSELGREIAKLRRALE
jgi:Tfp pilus assembly protein PilF